MAREFLETPFAAQPTALAQPVPGEEPEIIVPQAAPFQVPPQIPEEEDDIKRLTRKFFEQQPVVPEAPVAPAEAPQVPAVGDPIINDLTAKFFEEQEGKKIAAGSLDVKNRWIVGLAANQREAIGTLQNLGFDAKLSPEGELLFRKPGEKQFKKVDPSTGIADLIGDIADLSRIGIEIASEIAGGFLGFVFAGPAGVIPGAAAGAAAGLTLADNIAEALEVPQDPFRNKALERISAAAFSAIFNVGGKIIGRGLQQLQRLKNLKGQAVTRTDDVLQEIDTIADAVETAEAELGLKIIGVDGKPISVPLRAIETKDPGVNQLIRELGNVQETLISEGAFVSTMDDAIDMVLDNVGAKAGIRNAAAAIQSNPLAIKRIEGFLRQTKDVANSLIGDFKKLGSPVLTGELADSKTASALREMSPDLRISGPDGLIIPERLTKKNVARALSVSPKDPNLTTLFESIKKVSEDTVNKGGINFDAVELMIKDLNVLIRKSPLQIDGGIKANAARLASGLRKDRIDMVEAGLANTPFQGQFREAMKTRRSLFQLEDRFANLFDKGKDIVADKLIRETFNSGRFDKLISVRTFLNSAGKEDLWEELVGNFVDEVLKNSVRGGKISRQAFANNINKIPSAVREIVFKDAGVKPIDVMNFANAAARFEKTLLKELTEGERIDLAKKFISITSPFRNAQLTGIRGIVSTTINTLKGKGALRDLLSQEGLEQALLASQKATTTAEKTHLIRLANVFKLLGDIAGNDILRIPAGAALRPAIPAVLGLPTTKER